MGGGIGIKHDGGKLRWDLLPIAQVRRVVEVLTFGAEKYSPGNWQHVPEPVNRYYAAALRHLAAWRDGEQLDQESGLPHLAHAGCCVLFLLWFEMRDAAVFCPRHGNPARPAEIAGLRCDCRPEQ